MRFNATSTMHVVGMRYVPPLIMIYGFVYNSEIEPHIRDQVVFPPIIYTRPVHPCMHSKMVT